MSDNDSMLNLSRKGRITADATYLMLKGAGWALVFVLVIWAAMAILGGISALLPEDSKMAPDPTPTSHLEIVVPGEDAVIVRTA